MISSSPVAMCQTFVPPPKKNRGQSSSHAVLQQTVDRMLVAMELGDDLARFQIPIEDAALLFVGIEDAVGQLLTIV